MRKTGRVLIVNEDTEVTNFGEHLLRRVIDEHFYDLLVRPRVLAGKHVPGIGLNQVYEQNTVPQPADIKEAMRAVADGSGIEYSPRRHEEHKGTQRRRQSLESFVFFVFFVSLW